ncbi:ABC transporter ATP-binding protein [Lachnobacterium bovis]|uniref:ABC-2 type transport system ATP-binding protein n=1 Tax=Lachnobacterium bovis TaxID=140626 RepID=A0A1H9SP62_9FIRM|nr:ABC transporter ATP-binding protein [Lachnobacterium bovis]SER86694.1 ABC-2 type transport system ATP-binding protein [Lachnobacterium bovis]
MLVIKNVTKKYKNNFELIIPKLELESNRIYALLGKNGAGKSTTIKVMLGIEKKDSGSIKMGEEDLFENRNKIGYVPDEPMLIEKLTGREQLQYVSYIYDIDDNDISAGCDGNNKTSEYIKMFELEDRMDKRIEEYSKGMKQKISIMSSMIHNPDILILDEPFTGLDPVSIINMKEWMRKFVKKENKMIIFSSHDLDVVNDICTDAIFLKKGKIVAIEENNEKRTFTEMFKDYLMEN